MSYCLLKCNTLVLKCDAFCWYKKGEPPGFCQKPKRCRNPTSNFLTSKINTTDCYLKKLNTKLGTQKRVFSWSIITDHRNDLFRSNPVFADAFGAGITAGFRWIFASLLHCLFCSLLLFCKNIHVKLRTNYQSPLYFAEKKILRNLAPLRVSVS